MIHKPKYFNEKIIIFYKIINNSQNLTEKFVQALTRIFRICDIDRDNLLNDEELNKF